MTIAKDVVYALHERLKTLSTDATPDQLAYLAKALEAMAGQSTVYDIVQISDEKLTELLNASKTQNDNLIATKTKALSDIGTAQASAVDAIGSKKIDALTAIQTSSVTQLAALDSRKDTHVATIQSTGQAQVQAVTTAAEHFTTVNDIPAGSTIMTEVRNRTMIEPGALPFIFGILSRSNDHYGIGTMTSQLGPWANNVANADNMLQLLTGCHNYSTEYAGFYRPPQLHFLQGVRGNFIYKELLTKYAASSNITNYPYAGLGVLFVKNTTPNDIERPLSFGGSNMWSSNYEGMGVFVGTPSHTDNQRAQITGLAWNIAYSNTTSNQHVTGTTNVMLPAGKTVAIVFYTSAFYYNTGVANFYVQFMHWYIHSFRTGFLTAGLEVDIERTLKAWQCRGYANTYELFK